MQGVTGLRGTTGVQGTTGIQGTTGLSGSRSIQIFGGQFDFPSSADWAVTGIAPASTDPQNSAFTVRLFDDTAEEGVGFIAEIPTGTTSIRFDMRTRAYSTPAGSVAAVPRLYTRQVTDNAVMGSWSAATTLTSLAYTTNTYYQYDTQTITLSTLGLTAGRVTQFEFTRYGGSGSDTLVGDMALLEIWVTFV